MPTWTADARHTLEGYLEQNRGHAARIGADADEVMADLRRHIEAEIDSLHLPVVTQDDVQRIVARIGPVPAEEPMHPPATPTRASSGTPAPDAVDRAVAMATRAAQSTVSGALFFFGILLPLITLGFETVTRLCTGVLFDPLPTPLHLLLAAGVPAANLLAWLAVRHRRTIDPRLLWWANGAALGIAGYFSLIFLPLTPFALIGVVYFGFGLLPLSPLLSLLVTWRWRVILRRNGLGPVQPAAPAGHDFEVLPGSLADTERALDPAAPTGHGLGALPRRARTRGRRSPVTAAAPRGGVGDLLLDRCRRWGWSALLPGALLLLLAIPAPLTRVAIDRTGSDSPEEATAAVQWLRRFGSLDALLLECYGRGNRLWTDVFGGRAPNPELARKTYFRVTGQPFNAVPPPLSRYQQAGRVVFDDFDWDRDLGGTAVAGQVRGLTLVESRMDGLCQPDQAWGYLEWILEFENAHLSSQREARAQIQLPPGGVVSRVTLWVNGEEREAAFAGTAQVREAYERVAVQQRRDPVLVTVSGPDRVLVQCFPVPPAGGRMKVRLGITAPLVIENRDQVAWRLPSVLERNFGLRPDFQHHLWLESPVPPATSLGTALAPAQEGDRHGLHTQIADSDLSQTRAVLRFPFPSEPQPVRALDRRDANRFVVRQAVEALPARMPARIAIVLDGSADMDGAFPEIGRALEGIPGEPELAVWFVQDGIRQIHHSAWQTSEPVASVVARQHGLGGQDDLPALLQAWEWAAAQGPGTVLWIHGNQPVLLGSIEPLKQRLDWRPGRRGPALIDVPIHPGPNRALELLRDTDALESLPRLGALRDDLDRLFATWTGRRTEYRLVRTREPATTAPTTKTIPGADADHESMAGAPDANPAAGASSHVVRLWAAQQIRTLATARRTADAIRMASLYQLVTRVSGAVVLETAQQFRDAGLTPIDPLTAPSVPEPGPLALLAIGLALLFIRRSARTSRRG